MTVFKICGLRQVDHVLAASDAGADFLGFNFIPGVRRQIQEEQAKEIIQEYRRLRPDSRARLVGLFANQSLDEVNRILHHCGLDLAQLCGDEDSEYWDQVDVRVVKHIKVSDQGSRDAVVAKVLGRVEEVVKRGHIPLLDKHEAGALGGTGRSFDWGIAREVAGHHDILLAGGLSPENVSEAIATATPWGVDVSSGVETGGVKDTEKIAAFAREVQRSSLPNQNL